MTSCKKKKIDDGFFPDLVEGASRVGYMEIPELMDLGNAEVPESLVPFSRARGELKRGNTDAYVHFYEFDETFSEVITNIDKHIPVLRRFAGVVTPDCSMLDGQSNCLQATNTFFNRAVDFRLQKAGIPVICNLRWSDESSFDYCFLGVPRGSIVSIGTYGTIKGRKRQDDFRKGWLVMLDAVKPSPLTKAILGLEAKAEVVLSGMCILTTHCLRLGFFTT